MVSVALHVEGGGHRALNRECRRGFGKFLERAGAAGRVEVIACGSRENAYRSFAGAHAATNGAVVILLVDAETPVTTPGPWEHLKSCDNWGRPDGAADEQCHLMVEAMESWFLADMEALESFYGSSFRRQSLPQNPKVEQIPKQDVLDGLDRATQYVQKGRYNKGKHSFLILAELDPAKVRDAAPYADRLIRTLAGSP